MKNYRIYTIKKGTDFGQDSPPRIEIYNDSNDGFDKIDKAKNYAKNDNFIKSWGSYVILDCLNNKVVYCYPEF